MLILNTKQISTLLHNRLKYLELKLRSIEGAIVELLIVDSSFPILHLGLAEYCEVCANLQLSSVLLSDSAKWFQISSSRTQHYGLSHHLPLGKCF